MDTPRILSAFAGKEWLEILIMEHNQEVKEEERWPMAVLSTESGRELSWYFSSALGVDDRGVPASACRLSERYISRYAENFLRRPRDYVLQSNSAEYTQSLQTVANQFCLVTMSCVLLAAKMSDVQAPLNACRVRNCLKKFGLNYSTTEITNMESQVFSTLDYHLPLWSTLEITEFLSVQVGLTEARFIKALGAILNLVECFRDIIERHMRTWMTRNRYSQNPSRSRVYMLLLCAGVVSGTARFLHRPAAIEIAPRLAQMLRVDPTYLRALSDIILNRVISKMHCKPFSNLTRVLSL